MSLPFGTHGQPKGSWLRELLSLSSRPSPVPALCPELPLGLQETSLLPWWSPPARILLLPSAHAWRNVCFCGPWLCCSSWWDWCPPWAAGGIQPAIYLTFIICCPPIIFPGVYSIQHPCSLTQWQDMRKSKLGGTHRGLPCVSIIGWCWYWHRA